MPVYNFKNNADFYLVYGGLSYKLDVYTDVTFSQTFKEVSVKKKTIHERNLNFEDAVITMANPGNFSFGIPILEEEDLNAVLALMIQIDSDYNVKPFDLYVVTDSETYKMATCVIEDGTFSLERDGILGLSVSGTCSRLSRVGDQSYSVPATAYVRTSSTTFYGHNRMYVSIDSVEQDFVRAVSINFRNNIDWLSNDTLHKSLAVTNTDTTIYPEQFVLTGRTLSGAVEQNVTDTADLQVNTWKSDVPITIKIGAVNRWVLEFIIPEAIYTNRLVTASLFHQVYDFRMTSTPSDLSDVIVKYGYEGLPTGPAAPTYAVSPDNISRNEGQTVVFTVTTTDVANGTTLYWTNSGTSVATDFNDGLNSGSFTITSNSGSISRTISSDATTEGPETIILNIRTGSTSGTVVANSSTVTISDTSLNPTYAVSPNNTSPNEGDTVVFTVTTTDVPDGTTLYWTNSGTSTGADFSGGANSGSFTITSNSGSISRTIVNDGTTEGSETIIVNIRTVSTSGTIVATSSTVTIADTSLTPTYAVSPDNTSKNEGTTLTYTITTTNVANGTTLYWTKTGTSSNADFSSGDLASTNGSFTITSNTGSVAGVISNDVTTEGSETLIFEVRTGSTSGTIVATSSTVTIVDTSLSPSTPATILGSKLVEWWTANDATTITLSGSNVTNWVGKVASTSLDQATSTRQPVYSATSWNSGASAAITFAQPTSLPQFLRASSVPGSFPTTTAYSEIWVIIEVTDTDTGTARTRAPFTYGSATNGAHRGMRIQTVSTVFQVKATTGSVTTANTGGVTARHTIRGIHFTTPTGNIEAYLDTGSAQTAAVSTSSTSSGNVTAGATCATTPSDTVGFIGRIKEIWILNAAPSGGEDTSLRAYITSII